MRDCSLDMVFAMDASRSIGPRYFDVMKSSVMGSFGRLETIDSCKLIDTMQLQKNYYRKPISPVDPSPTGNARVGFVTYASNIGTVSNLNAHASVARVQSDMNSMRYLGGLTNTDAALKYVRTSMLTSAAGDRPDAPNVVVLLTAGQSSKPTVTRVCNKIY